MSEIDWKIEIDWTLAGDYSGTYDEVTADVRLLSIDISAGRSAATEEFSAARASFTLENPDGRFSRYDATSPLFGLMARRPAVRITSTHAAVSTVQFVGRLMDTTEQIGGQGVPAVVFDCLDAFDELRRGKITVSLVEGETVDELLDRAADAAGWPAGRRAFDVSRTELPVYWAYQRTPLGTLLMTAAQDLGGQFYVNKSGDLTFENREHRTFEPLYATISDVDELSLGMRYEDLVDRVRGRRSGLSIGQTLAPVFTLAPAGYRLDPGSSSPRNTIWITWDTAGAKDPVTPVPFLDYNATGDEAGESTNKTAQVAVSSFSAFGGGAKLVLDNQDSAPVYLNGEPALQVRAYPIEKSSDDRIVDALAADPLVEDQDLEFEFEFVDDPALIYSWAALRAATLSRDQPRPAVRLDAVTDAQIATALGIAISARIRLTHTTGLYPSQIDGEFFVEGYTLADAVDEPLSLSLALWPSDQVHGNLFRISDASPAAALSAIVDGSASTFDRIGF